MAWRRLPWLAVTILMVGLACTSADRARAERFREISVDVDKLVPVPQQGGGSVPSITTDVEGSAAVATQELVFVQGNDCSYECQGPDCPPANVACQNTAFASVQIEPDPGDTIGDPVRICVVHTYEMAASSTPGYTTEVRTGGVPVETATSVILIPGGTQFSNGSVAITSGTDQGNFNVSFPAVIGDIIEARLATRTTVMGMGAGGGRGIQTATLRVFTCGLPAPAPVMSHYALALLLVLLGGCGVWTLRRRSEKRLAA